MNLYHFLPRNLTGTTLYPLNRLKQKFPDIYNEHLKKYKGREAILETVIPSLNCLWNDVLHFSPVHPMQIRDAIIEANFPWSGPFQWVELNPTDFNFSAENAVIYHYQERELGDFTVNPTSFRPFSHEQLSPLSAIPDETTTHYKVTKERNERPFVFHCIPHILYQGTVDLIQTNIISI